MHSNDFGKNMVLILHASRDQHYNYFFRIQKINSYANRLNSNVHKHATKLTYQWESRRKAFSLKILHKSGKQNGLLGRRINNLKT